MSPRITVYIASHNYGRFVREAIDSVMRQTVNDWELLLINDGSIDDTADILDNFDNHLQVSVFHTDGIGLPSVNNLALNEAKGKYIIRLDGDDVFDENILLILANYLDQNDEMALVFPDYYLMDEAGEIFAHEVRLKLHVQDHVMDEPPNGACTMVRTQVLRDIGGYREDLGAQDGLDLWLKVKDNYKSSNVNLPLFFYRRHGNNLTEQPLKILNAKRKIKSDMAYDMLEKRRPINVVIPCRENYDFVDNLWAQEVVGKSLLERDLNICVSSKLFDNIIVACDNPAAEETVNKFKNNNRVRFFLRDKKMTVISRSIVETLNQIIDDYDPELEGIVLMRYIQTPFVSRETMEEAINTLIVSKTDSAFAVERIRHEIFERRENGLIPLNYSRLGKVNTSNLYRDSSTCIAVKSHSLKSGDLRGTNAASFSVSAAESFFIRCSNDLEIANNLDIAHVDNVAEMLHAVPI
jgi:glycosyltransferase involved in cell wall biosynthesis